MAPFAAYELWRGREIFPCRGGGLMPGTGSTGGVDHSTGLTSARRILRLELQHEASAIGRACLIGQGSELEPDLIRLREAALATLDLAQSPGTGKPAADPRE